MTQPIIKLENVTKRFHLYNHISGFKGFLFNPRNTIKAIRSSQYTALEDISVEVQKGEALGIIGRNGAGKSTMLGLLAGVMQPTSGKLTVQGRISPMLELGGGFHHELTGRENIVLNGVLLGLTRSIVLGKMEQIIEFSGLGDFIDQPIKIYSSGMLGRLGFSVVAHLDPEVLLIDEVLAVGDADFQQKCIAKMLEFKNRNVTMVFVSHSMADVERICDKVLWIEDHGMKMFGDKAKVIKAYVGSY